MAIDTYDGLKAATKQRTPIKKLASRTVVASIWFSLFDIAGDPGAGVLAGTSTANGVVPTDVTAGTPLLNAFGGGATGELAVVEFSSTVASRLMLFDMLFKAGAYAFTAATTTLSAQPSYSDRVPGGTDFTNTEIWMEVSTAFVTGTAWQVRVTYTNQDGVAGRSTIITAAMAAAALTLGKMLQLPLQAGDSGVQLIESVITTNGGTAMTAGAFNILVIRPLLTMRVRVANDGDVYDWMRMGSPQVFETSALCLAVAADSTASGLPEVMLTIANG